MHKNLYSWIPMRLGAQAAVGWHVHQPPAPPLESSGGEFGSVLKLDVCVQPLSQVLCLLPVFNVWPWVHLTSGIKKWKNREKGLAKGKIASWGAELGLAARISPSPEDSSWAVLILGTRRLFPESLSNNTAASGRRSFSVCPAFSYCYHCGSLWPWLNLIKSFPNPGQILTLPTTLALLWGPP